MIKTIHFLGNIFILLADMFKMMSNLLKFMLVMGIIIGIFMATMIAGFDLIDSKINVFGKTVWDVIILVIGTATMWQGIVKLTFNDLKPNIKKDSNYD